MNRLKDWSFIVMCCEYTMFEDSFVFAVRFVDIVGPHPSNSLHLPERLIKECFPYVANSLLDCLFSKDFFRCDVLS
jgi:hypothetical protein